MVDHTEEWRPGSFTKNFSWGTEKGFAQLYESIRIGYDLKLEDVSRQVFRDRLKHLNRPDYIPINFFLFNRPKGGVDYLVVDELVYQAITGNHSPRFDKLALFAFNFSYTGVFGGAKAFQRRPALWATRYIQERIAKVFDWDTSRVNADDIERFLHDESRFVAKTERKVATNLAHLYKIGRIGDLKSDRVDRWWVDALFLALDRLIEDRSLKRIQTSESEFLGVLRQSEFADVSGRGSIEKDLAVKHLVRLYAACGARERFSEQAVKSRTELLVEDLQQWANSNDPDPIGAIHPTNVRILKSIPPTCAMLATYAGFDLLSSMAIDEFDADDFIRGSARAALDRLKAQGIRPTMSAEDLLKLTRGE
jgi:hypothetical protein